MKKWILLAVVLVVLGGVGFVWFRAQSQQTAAMANLQTVEAEVGDLTAVVGATGIVRANQTGFLSWLTSGTVAEVNVGVGDRVERDQILASLGQSSLPQTVIQAQGELVSARQALADLLNSDLQTAQALQAVEDAENALADALKPDLTRAQAQEAVATAQKAVETAENYLRWAQSPASQSYIDEAEAQVTIAKDQLDKAKEKYAPYSNKPEDNLTRARLLSEMSAAQQQYDAAVRNLNSMQGTASETDIQIRQAELSSAQAQLAEAQRDWERVKDGPSEAEIALLEAQLKDAQRELERVKSGADPDDIEAAEARIAAAEATINQARLTAPFNAVVTDVISMVGDQVAPGSSAFRLDDLSRLLMDVQVSEVDINRIQAGQEAVLTFDAILGQEYHGHVIRVAPVGTSEQGVVDFTVTIELDDADQAVKPGMTAAVNMVVQQLEEVLLVPNRAVRIQENRRVVYVLRSGPAPEAVPIELGASSETMSEVVAGDLKAGDKIVLNPPALLMEGPQPGFMGR